MLIFASFIKERILIISECGEFKANTDAIPNIMAKNINDTIKRLINLIWEISLLLSMEMYSGSSDSNKIKRALILLKFSKICRNPKDATDFAESAFAHLPKYAHVKSVELFFTTFRALYSTVYVQM